MTDLRERLLAAFEVEHKEHLETVRLMLDTWEGSAGSETLDLVELHRRLHSLKGAARAVDMQAVERLSHALESLVEECQGSAAAMDGETARTILRAIDAIEDSVAASLAGVPPPELDEVTGAVIGTRGVTQADLTVAAADAAGPGKAEGEATVNGSGQEKPGAERPVDGMAGQEPAPNGPAVRTQALTRVDASHFSSLVQSSSELIAGLDSGSETLADIRSAEQQIMALGDTASRVRVNGERGDDDWCSLGNDETVPAGLRRIGALLRNAARRERDQAWRMRRLGRSLRRQIGELQTVSADSVLGGARKVVRDIAREQGKQVRVTLRGLDTPADRAVLQHLKDPVHHMLRNAVHHGIEAREERVRCCKAAEGHVTIAIATRGPELVVTVEDDGRGIDRDQILSTARARGLVDNVAAGDMDDRALTGLLSQPGFSTADSITEVAGRGMGLSVVADSVTRLGGTFSIEPRQPHGTRSAIVVPASVLAMRFALVEAAGGRACIPLGRIARIHLVPMSRVEVIEARAYAVERERAPMALVPLASLLGWGEPEKEEYTQALKVVELKTADARFGIVVDGVIGVQEGVMRNLELDPAFAACVSGGLVLEAGAVVPVLDAAALCAAYRRDDRRGVLPSCDAGSDPARNTILIVDDSITTRTLEQSILEANGYRVRLSADGADALRQLRNEGVELVISDVEMPNMDGFALLAAMKKERDLAEVPVILVTSRNDEADRRRGLDLGASAYVVKQRFNQAELLKMVGRLL